MNRRELLSHTGAGMALGFCAAVVVAAPGCAPEAAPAAERDPMADLATAYTDRNEWLNALDIEDEKEVAAFCAEHIDPLRDQIMKAAPAPTTMAGVLAAVRLAERSAGQGDYELAEPLIAAARRFLEVLPRHV